MAGLLKRLGKASRRFMADAFNVDKTATPFFEAASQSRRMNNFNPPREHINRAIEAAGDTLVARSRWLYENEPHYGAAVDEWVSATVSDGIKPHPRIRDHKKNRKELLDLWWQWADEADFAGGSDYYGLQTIIAREVFIGGEAFVRMKIVDDDSLTIPLQLEVYPTEMLDMTYNGPAEVQDNYIRMGIEFNQQGKRVAYHFWRYHPYDDRPTAEMAFNTKERVRISAKNILHIKERRQAGQLRGSPKVARAMTKLFQLDSYDDAELDRKKTAALFTAFRIGRGENPIEIENDDNALEPEPLPELQPGAFVDLGDDSDIRFSAPAEVGGSYEPFQYRNILKICAALNMPYAVVTGDVTRGNFSNVRTAIIQFRRHVKQWRGNVLAFQLNRAVWARFVDIAVLSSTIELPHFDSNPRLWQQSESFAPPLEMIEPLKDIAAEKEELRAGLKSRTQSLQERGYDREDIDHQIREERQDAANGGLVFDTAADANEAAKNSTTQKNLEDDGPENDQSSAAHQQGE